MDLRLYEIEHAVRACGKQMINANEELLVIEEKEGIGNIVTNYDKLIQEKLRKELSKIIPDASFVGEENNEQDKILKEGYTFIVDPIDGTTNFSKRFSCSAISVAVLKDGKQYLGVCFNPYANEMFTAQKGMGAFLNNKKIQVSKKKISEGIIQLGSAPYYPELRNKTAKYLSEIIKDCEDYRRFGSAVIELCNVACGRCEAYIELLLQPWDCAAASLIVTEAGGKVTDVEGKKIKFDKGTSIVASNGCDDYLKYFI